MISGVTDGDQIETGMLASSQAIACVYAVLDALTTIVSHGCRSASMVSELSVDEVGLACSDLYCGSPQTSSH